jgi:hypothetical protein
MTRADPQIQGRVDRLFDRFERMSDAEFVKLRSAWDAEDATARQEAWTMVKVGLTSTKRDRLLDDARNRIAAWVNNYSYRMAAPDTMGFSSGSGMDAASIRKAAIPPMLDAIAATIVADDLDQDARWALLKPYEAISR